jgi:glycosyltransferase involved in cell wall biosynthesis
MRKKVVYIHPGFSSFVQKDISLLETEFDLKIHFFSLKSKKELPLSFLKESFFLLKNLFSTKIWVIQFAGYQSFIPVLFGKLFFKKTVIVLGGTDCVGFPSIQYGCFYNKQLKPFTSFSLKHAKLLLPVDQTLVEYDYTYQDRDYPKQGFQYHVPGIKTPYKVIYNGFDSEKWLPLKKEEKSFVTVAADLNTRFGVQLKGIDLIISAAKDLPFCSFYIVGGKELNFEIPSNVFLIDRIPNNQLTDFIGSKQFYLQLSMSEGFPNALAEAMLCGCIPIVSNVGAMPMIIEDAGYVLLKKDKNMLISLIQLAIKDENKDLKSTKAREIVSSKYNIEKRKSELIKIIHTL